MPYLTLIENLKLQLSPGLVASYDIQPGNGVGLFWDKHTHVYLLTYLLTYFCKYQPWPVADLNAADKNMCLVWETVAIASEWVKFLSGISEREGHLEAQKCYSQTTRRER